MGVVALPLLACTLAIGDVGALHASGTTTPRAAAAAAADGVVSRRRATPALLMSMESGAAAIRARFTQQPVVYRRDAIDTPDTIATPAAEQASTGAWWLAVAPSVLLANALTVTLTAIGGDLLSQSLEASGYSLVRTVRFTLFRVCLQMPMYAAWIGFLERFNRQIPPHAVPAAKTAIECVTYTPLYQMFFFTVMALSEGLALSDAFGRAVQTLPVSLPASFKFWIPVQVRRRREPNPAPCRAHSRLRAAPYGRLPSS